MFLFPPSPEFLSAFIKTVSSHISQQQFSFPAALHGQVGISGFNTSSHVEDICPHCSTGTELLAMALPLDQKPRKPWLQPCLLFDVFILFLVMDIFILFLNPVVLF